MFDSDHYRIVLYGLKLLANPRDVATGKTLWTSVAAINDATAASDEDFEGEALPDQILPVLAKQVRGSALESPLRTLAHCATKRCDVTQGVEELLRWNFENGDDQALSELIGADREFLAQRWTSYKSSVDRKERTWQGLILEILNKPKPEAPGLRILTVHAAKGLEFRAVTVTWVRRGLIPGTSAMRTETRWTANSAWRTSPPLAPPGCSGSLGQCIGRRGMALVCKTSLGSLQLAELGARPPAPADQSSLRTSRRAVASQALFALDVEMWTKQSL